MNPSERLVAELRAGAHRDVDAIFDAWPEVMENRRSLTTTDSGRPRRSTGSHSDPTGETASSMTPAMRWLDEVKAILRTLQRQAAQLDELVGRPACAGCGQELAGRPWRRFLGRRYHDDGCRQRAMRAREKTVSGADLVARRGPR